VAKIARLTAAECMAMIRTIVTDQPAVKTIIFQDDIFVFTNDNRIIELCDSIRRAKAAGEIPESLEFISTNRIDAMTPERLTAMKRADFRVVGFGVESFSEPVLREFNKAHSLPAPVSRRQKTTSQVASGDAENSVRPQHVKALSHRLQVRGRWIDYIQTANTRVN
jgi:radical SAM superfamily enzyme YgiQ (UPF0313 family)